MDKRLLQKFLYEIARQCRFCLTAYEDLNQVLRQRNTGDRLWYSIQSFLIASGNISKLLFGTTTQSRDQRADLRRSLGVDDSSPLNDRAARNYFEHFDERLERWFNDSTRYNFVDSSVSPLQQFGGVDEHDFIRNLDPGRMAITFYGDECLMIPIVEAVKQLRERIKVEAENNRWHIPL
jgi:hypothetical protein